MAAPTTPTVLHLVASPFLGGPERQMIGLARARRGGERTVFLGFPEGGELHRVVREEGLESHLLAATGRPFPRAVREVVAFVRRLQPDAVVTHGYKPDLVGLVACRITRTPMIAVSHGWTGATRRVRVSEAVDRLVLRGARRVVAVSRKQGERVADAGVRRDRIVVVQNAVDPSRFGERDAGVRAELESFFPHRPERIVVAAGRLSPEKGFGDLVTAAARVTERMPGVGFLLVGDGPLRAELEGAVKDAGLAGSFAFAGFRNDLDRLLPSADLLVQSSHTEGLPNVILEAGACGLPIVATDVGGTGEVLEEGRGGRLVRPRAPELLADRIVEVLRAPEAALRMGAEARRRIHAEFTFSRAAAAYRDLFQECLA